MNTLRHVLWAAALWAAAGGACACSPSLNTDIFFAKNQARLTATELRRLADFSIRIRAGHLHHDFLGIAGNASDDERQPAALARQRARVVRQYFERTGYQRAPMEIHTHVYRASQHTASNNLHRTEIMLALKPPNTCAAQAPRQAGQAQAPVTGTPKYGLRPQPQYAEYANYGRAMPGHRSDIERLPER